MFSSTVRSSLCTMVPSPLRQESPAMRPKSRPSATSLMVKSNSLRATKSIAGDAFRLSSGSTATFAPIMPIFRLGLSALSASAVRTSDENDGVEVCITTRSRLVASGAMS